MQIVKIRMAFDDLVIPPLREFDDFFPGNSFHFFHCESYCMSRIISNLLIFTGGNARFGSPNFNDLPRLNNRIINNLERLQMNIPSRSILINNIYKNRIFKSLYLSFIISQIIFAYF